MIFQLIISSIIVILGFFIFFLARKYEKYNLTKGSGNEFVSGNSVPLADNQPDLKGN
jgi:hypothetical protein